MPYPFEHASTCAEELAIAQALPREELVEAVLSYGWDSCVASTMGAIADREDCPLIAVLFMFDLGDADYHAENLGQGDRGMYDLFVRIQERINAGGYMHLPEDHLTSDTPSVDVYLRKKEHNSGDPVVHWALDPDIVCPALQKPALPLSEREEQRAQELFAEIKLAVPNGEAAVKPIVMQAVMAGRRVENRVEELIAAEPRKKRGLKPWIFPGLCLVALCLILPDFIRIFQR